MATEEEVEIVIDELNQDIADVADDTERFTQEDSAQIFEGIAAVCTDRARTIRQEMEDEH